MRRFICLTVGAAILSACASLTSVSAPVMVVTNDGRTLQGIATTTMTSGTFSAMGSDLSCNGSFDPAPGSRTVSLTVSCNDGRNGVGTAYRDTTVSGSGVIYMTDGTQARFVFGPAAQ